MAGSTPILDYAYGTVPGTPGFANPSDVFDYTITALRGVSTALEAIVTTGLGTLSIKRTAIGQSEQVWQLLAGAADATDPTGQVAPLDYSVSNNRHWQKIGGF